MICTIIIGGLGRCGSTLLMQMLSSVDVPTVGFHPDWECMETQHLLEYDPWAWEASVRGKAVKVLDAHRWTMPPIANARLIWLSRDADEQAKSMLKLLQAMFAGIDASRSSRRQLAKSIRFDTALARKALMVACGLDVPVLGLTFETILSQPKFVAGQIAEYLGLGEGDEQVMAAQVLKRTPECLPYLAEAQYFTGQPA